MSSEEQRIREFAYQIWQSEGCPEGEDERHWAMARKLVEAHGSLDLPPRTVLNVNIPNLPLDHIRGIQLTRLGHRARAAAPLKVVDPRGKEGYWIAAAGDAEDGGPGTDFHAVMQGYVSITPLQLDRTFSDAFSGLDGWLEGLR